jgi:hypothetical protein
MPEMAKFLLPILILLVSIAAAAQDLRPACPKIIVSGPAGITIPGEPIHFVATVDPEIPASAKLRWTVRKAQIIDGWGSLHIVVLSEETEVCGGSLSATLEIEGLPTGCPYEFTETLTICCPPESILIDESNIAVNEIDHERLAFARAQQKNNPTNQLYIIEYFPPFTSEISIQEKIERIQNFMSEDLEFDPLALTIVVAEADEPRTRIYRVPPGAENPMP